MVGDQTSDTGKPRRNRRVRQEPTASKEILVFVDGFSESAKFGAFMSPNQRNFSMQTEQVAEYEWEEQFDARAWPIRAHVFFVPLSLDLNSLQRGGKYNTSVFIGGDWQPFYQWEYEPSEVELKARVKAELPTWKAIGTI